MVEKALEACCQFLRIVLVIARVPVAFTLGIATIPLVVLDLRLTPFVIMDRMLNSYTSFILLVIPFFLLAANLLNSGKITDRLTVNFGVRPKVLV